MVNILAMEENLLLHGEPVMVHSPANDFEVQLNVFHFPFGARSILCPQLSSLIDAQ